MTSRNLITSTFDKNWILQGWQKISSQEKEHINSRMYEIFKDGLPFELKQGKLLYIYTFSFLAQLEILALQIPLTFKEKLPTAQLRKTMHLQLVDEIFHVLVFKKIVKLLCLPDATPPAYDENLESLCNFIRMQECPKMGVVLFNLIGKGWLEQIFYSLTKSNIAPKVFSEIFKDEQRHFNQVEMYKEIGIPPEELIISKLAYLEEKFLPKMLFQYRYSFSFATLIGLPGIVDFLESLNKRHTEQLSKINLKPSEKWLYFMKFSQDNLPKKIRKMIHSF
ncbi:putative CoA-dependent acyltransferase (plasmid) [Legionella adelaidensis]|uniref:Putative CoA-dependent acyltransferase n=1 Tax=Legionella adelaidensis TaxID=45056 RepID=A0A0W0R6C9_9GAMM|nr:hypothetical protein [Legionella adelaidensis]KTC66589.1 putative CoA-dependent acyltransferase [Legionella adelaidensis]VEH85496.1 putative CoA-dependent acyltransferase [Legionella adelaidensis]